MEVNTSFEGRAMECTYFENSLTSSKVLSIIRINQIFHDTRWASIEYTLGIMRNKNKMKWGISQNDCPQVQAFHSIF